MIYDFQNFYNVYNFRIYKIFYRLVLSIDWSMGIDHQWQSSNDEQWFVHHWQSALHLAPIRWQLQRNIGIVWLNV